MKKIYRTIHFAYKTFFSASIKLLFGSDCRFEPTCSDYAAAALTKYGLLKGSRLAIKRLLRCNPWGGYGLDPLK